MKIFFCFKANQNKKDIIEMSLMQAIEKYGDLTNREVFFLSMPWKEDFIAKKKNGAYYIEKFLEDKERS